MQSTPSPSTQASTGLAPLLAAPATPAAAAGREAVANGVNKAFQQVWAGVQPRGQSVQVQSGDTLIGLVKAHYRQNGLPISEQQAFRLAQQVASQNQIANPDWIVPGQKIDFASLNLPALSRAPALEFQAAGVNPRLNMASVNTRMPPALASDMLAQRGMASTARTTDVNQNALGKPLSSHPVLDKTLERAADKGFVPSEQLALVKQKVLSLAQRYNFVPDDFARLSLMESGGMNPQASNGSCHGIIQFCEGANRGAAAVGMKNNPRAILGMGLLQQLDLVDKYFSQAGLNASGPRIGLDDLYLTVLMPSAKQETRPDAALPIAGPQARALHVGGDPRAPITRNSLMSGLHALTQSLLQPGPAKAAGNRWYANVESNTSDTLR